MSINKGRLIIIVRRRIGRGKKAKQNTENEYSIIRKVFNDSIIYSPSSFLIFISNVYCLLVLTTTMI